MDHVSTTSQFKIFVKKATPSARATKSLVENYILIVLNAFKILRKIAAPSK